MIILLLVATSTARAGRTCRPSDRAAATPLQPARSGDVAGVAKMLVVSPKQD